ncbi:MAG: serine/threonine protein kinase, partial [Deltaproteobacteria bacterium]|nr:serine/threonine protein kinase [Deltaproteobacteria bacterium]
MSESIFQPGQEIENFVIERQIGRGGMSELFLAKDAALKRRVVIKVLNPRYSDIDRFKKHFLQEARIQANLDNPHIVQILSMMEHHDHFCLVMQHVDGTDLNRVIEKAKSVRQKRGEKGALSLERAIHIFLQMLEGIGFVHKYRIIHGDVKPANILLDEQGRVKVADFGLSFLLPQERSDTEEILPGGTPYYMSPEQMLHEEIDIRSDIYSLGVTLFYMLTGIIPLEDKKKLTQILEVHLDGAMDIPRKIFDEFDLIPSGTKNAILKALEKDPDKRHQSCLEFSLAIREEAPVEMYSEL